MIRTRQYVCECRSLVLGVVVSTLKWRLLAPGLNDCVGSLRGFRRLSGGCLSCGSYFVLLELVDALRLNVRVNRLGLPPGRRDVHEVVVRNRNVLGLYEAVFRRGVLKRPRVSVNAEVANTIAIHAERAWRNRISIGGLRVVMRVPIRQSRLVLVNGIAPVIVDINGGFCVSAIGCFERRTVFPARICKRQGLTDGYGSVALVNQLGLVRGKRSRICNLIRLRVCVRVGQSINEGLGVLCVVVAPLPNQRYQTIARSVVGLVLFVVERDQASLNLAAITSPVAPIIPVCVCEQLAHYGALSSKFWFWTSKKISRIETPASMPVTSS